MFLRNTQTKSRLLNFKSSFFIDWIVQIYIFCIPDLKQGWYKFEVFSVTVCLWLRRRPRVIFLWESRSETRKSDNQHWMNRNYGTYLIHRNYIWSYIYIQRCQIRVYTPRSNDGQHRSNRKYEGGFEVFVKLTCLFGQGTRICKLFFTLYKYLCTYVVPTYKMSCLFIRAIKIYWL